MPERFTSRRDTFAFIICLIMSITARYMPADVQHVVSAAITNTVLRPFLIMQEQIELLRTAGARAVPVRGRRDSIALQALEVYELREENVQLRGLLSLSQRLAVDHVSVAVLHQASPADGLTLVLSAGRDRGVEPLDPVVAPQGLLGVIQNVNARTSVALVWTHPEFRASAMTADGNVFGIVAAQGSEGPNTALLELRGVPFLENVAVGTRVFTSGFGGVYPRGIPIGTVMAVGEEREGWSRTYVVRPGVHPASVSHAIILTGDGGEAAVAFEDDSR